MVNLFCQKQGRVDLAWCKWVRSGDHSILPVACERGWAGEGVCWAPLGKNQVAMETITPSNHPTLFPGGPFLLSLSAKQLQGFFSAHMSVFLPPAFSKVSPHWSSWMCQRDTSLLKVGKRQIQPTGNLPKLCFQSHWALGQLDLSNLQASFGRKSTEKPQHFGLVKLYFQHYYRNLKCTWDTFGRRNTGLIQKWTLSGWIESVQILHSSSHPQYTVIVIKTI